MSKRVLATARSFCATDGLHKELLLAEGYELILAAEAQPLSAERLADLIPGFHAAILGLDECDARVLGRADALEVISRFGVGVDRIDLCAAAARGIAVTTTPGANAVAVAELTVGLLFSLARAIPQHAAAAWSGDWSRTAGWELTGKTLGIVGCGAIGREVAARALALGMSVVAHDPFTPSFPTSVTPLTLERLLEEADAVTLHAALTSESRHLIGDAELQRMKATAVLINTSRGGLVDEAALARALQQGIIAGAAADAFEHEPPIGSPLLALPNFIATPHLGAATTESITRMALTASLNVIQILSGRPCAYRVSLPSPSLEEA